MTFGDISDRTSLNQFDDSAVIVFRMNLSAHLCRHTSRGCGFANDSSLIDIVSQGLFAIDMLTQLQSGKRCEGVSMFTGTDHYSIEFIGMVKDSSEVRFFASLAMLLHRTIQIVGVHVAKCGNMLRGNGLQISAAATSTSDDGDSQLVKVRRTARCRCPGEQPGGQERCRPEKRSTI